MNDIFVEPFEVIMRLLASGLIGGIIGLERESSNRPAGFRTHILVTISACLIMMVSATAFNPIGMGNDPMRLAAQVLSGIGFLGAGTIIRDGGTIRGLTTAASLWTCSAIGLAIGSGLYLFAGVAAIITIVTLEVLDRIDANIKNKILGGNAIKELSITTIDKELELDKFEKIVGKSDIDIKNVSIKRREDYIKLVLKLQGKNRIKEEVLEELINKLMNEKDVIEVNYEKY